MRRFQGRPPVEIEKLRCDVAKKEVFGGSDRSLIRSLSDPSYVLQRDHSIYAGDDHSSKASLL